jgi:hypothetical protein
VIASDDRHAFAVIDEQRVNKQFDLTVPMSSHPFSIVAAHDGESDQAVATIGMIDSRCDTARL